MLRIDDLYRSDNEGDQEVYFIRIETENNFLNYAFNVKDNKVVTYLILPADYTEKGEAIFYEGYMEECEEYLDEVVYEFEHLYKLFSQCFVE